jgi:outer membrane protein assembly complex protein YaeT
VKREGFALAALRMVGAGLLAAALLCPALAPAQTSPTTSISPTTARNVTPAGDLKGQTVESVSIRGNKQVSSAVIANLIRTRVGSKFDPATVEEDYQRIYGLRKFANVEAKAEPTATGVAVIFIVTEQREVTSIVFRGNTKFTQQELEPIMAIRVGEAIDPFRISLSRQAIENLYKSKNYTFAHVSIDNQRLAQKGELVFDIVEGPNVRVRNVTFPGAHSFTDDKLRGEVQTKSWIWIFRHGTLDFDTLDDDVAALRRFFEHHGFFDARVGRKLIWSPDNSEVQVNFEIDEGPRYTIDRVSFRGNASLSEAQLRSHLRLLESSYYDDDVLQHDVRELVRAYSPFGYIYQPQINDPAYLRIEARKVFRKDAAKVEIIYDISEGRPFHIGQILVRGNTKTQDKVVLREMRMAPGALYNSGEIQDALDRLRAMPYFNRVTITPIGDAPDTRDVLVEANDKDVKTANFTIGAGVNSNGGLGANLTYEQKNFDITNWPRSPKDFFDGTAFIGAGQLFRISLEPGTQQTNASIRFTEPWLFDQPYSLTEEIYLRTRQYEVYDEQRLGNRVTLGKRFNYTYSGLLTLRTELVDVRNIQDKPIRAQEILDEEGTSSVLSTVLQLRRDTTNRGVLPSRGNTTTLSWEAAGWLGGDFNFQKFSLTNTYYKTVREDLLGRKTILSISSDAGFIFDDAPFFERFYGGGIGSVRGFQFRGISPRSGPDDDRVGGDFLLTGSAQVSFPVAGDTLRGVVFFDAGLVEPTVRISTVRTAVGGGIRLTLPLLGQTPIAVDLAYPITKDSEDDTQIISFSLGFSQ